MVSRSHDFETVAKQAGFNYKVRSGDQGYAKPELKKIAEALGIEDLDRNAGRIKEEIGEKCGFNYEQGFSSTPRNFNEEEIKSIKQTLNDLQ